MSDFNKIIFLLLLVAFTACQQESAKTTMSAESSEELPILSEKDFTPIDKIDPQVYFPTNQNKTIDPHNELTEMFRQKKAADMSNPDKPRPLPEEDINPLENIAHQQPWAPLDKLFKFDWKRLGENALSDLSKVAKARLIFDNLDLKVIELAVAAGAILPLHAEATPSVYHILGGTAEVISNQEKAIVYPGTSITFDSYAQKRVSTNSLGNWAIPSAPQLPVRLYGLRPCGPAIWLPSRPCLVHETPFTDRPQHTLT